jgi:hypothetical protein
MRPLYILKKVIPPGRRKVNSRGRLAWSPIVGIGINALLGSFLQLELDPPKMETDDLGSLHRIVEIAGHGVIDQSAQLLQSLP